MLPASFFAIAAIALCPILEAMGAIGPGTSTLGTLAGVAYLAIRCGMILEDRLSDIEAQPGRRSRATKRRRTGRTLVTR